MVDLTALCLVERKVVWQDKLLGTHWVAAMVALKDTVMVDLRDV